MLIGATLRKADFTAAQLQGAQLDRSDLRGAKFECADTPEAPSQQCAQLQGASLENAQLQGASLKDAQLQGASLDYAQLQGASLALAQLQGASLDYAHLQGAQLWRADLQGALLVNAHLQGASLVNAHLQGAFLKEADLQGASLDGAQLQGASLDAAQLQGATLDYAGLQGASFETVFAWRADARDAVWEDTRVVNPAIGPKYMCEKNDEPSTCDWTPQSFNELKKMIAEQVPEGDKQHAAMERIEKRLDPSKPLEGEDEMAKRWEAQSHSSPATDVYETRLAGIWRETGCAAEGAPYVIRGLLVQLESASSPFDKHSPQLPALAKAFLDEEHCPGAHGLSDAEKAKLKEIRDRPPPPAPKP